MREILQGIYEASINQDDLVMATIMQNQGSSPRTAGTKMLIRRDNSIVATIGGGSLEANVILEAGKVFSDKMSRIYHFELTGDDVAQMDMICGGFGDVLLSYIAADDAISHAVFAAALQAASKNEQGWLVTQYSNAGTLRSRYCFIDQFGEKTGDLEIDGESLAAMKGTPGEISIHSEILQNSEILVERVQERRKLILFGGGHVSRETAQLAALVDFEVTVIDDRVEFANAERFPNAQTIVVDDYQHLPDLGIGSQSFVAIITRGHLGDYDVLKSVIQTDAFYIGMIGSRRKREMIYQRLRDEGISQEQIDRVHSPIGLTINGQTPAEIAVSIVAELILERSKIK